MTSAENTVGARLSLSGRAEFVSEAREASTAVTGIGEAAKRVGIKAAEGAKGMTEIATTARRVGRETEETMGAAGRGAGRGFLRSFNESTRSFASSARRRGREAGERMGEGFSERFRETVKTFAAPLLGFFAAEKGLDFVKEGVAGAQANRVASQQTKSALKTTHGVSGQTTEGVGELAEEMSGINAQTKAANQSMLNMILTFPKIRGKQFKETAEAADDMAARFKIGLPGAAKVLAKVLNDPAKGLTGLNRVGIKFTDQQTKNIKAMVAQGKTAEAQSLILEAVNSRVGGSAAAMVTPQQRLHHAVEVMSESFGAKLLPLMDKFSKWGVSKGLPMLERLGSFLENKVYPPIKSVAEALEKNLMPSFKSIATFIVNKVIPVLMTLGDWLSKHIVSALKDFGKWAGKNQGTVKVFIGTILVLVAAMKVFAIVMAIVNAVLDANPIVLIVLAIAALAAGVYYAYTHFKTFRTIIQDIGKVIKTVFNWIKQHWHLISEILFGPFILAYHFINSHMGMIKSIIRGVISFIKSHWELLFGILTGGVGPAVVWIVQHFNSFKTTLSGIVKTIGAILGGIWDGVQAAWNHSLGPVFGWIASKIQWIEDKLNALKGNPNGITSHGGTVGGGVTGFSGTGAGVATPAGTKRQTGTGNNAGGTNFWRGGLTWVGEHGRELLNLPRGSQLTSNSRSERILEASRRLAMSNYSSRVAPMDSGSSGARAPLPPVHVHLKLKGREIAHAVYDEMAKDGAYVS